MSAASFEPRDVFASNLAILTHGANVGVAFSLVTFFWRSKRKLLPRGMSAIVEVRFAVTTSTLTCPPGILSRPQERPIIALREDYELDPRFREDDGSA